MKAMNECSKIHKLISDYKKNNRIIQNKCNEISMIKLIVFETKNPQDDKIFENSQQTNREECYDKIKELIEYIKTLLKEN